MPGPNVTSPWWKRLLSPSGVAGRPAPPISPSLSPLTALLAPDGVVVWENPVTRADVVRTLAERVVPHVEGPTVAEALQRLAERDALGSTAIGEGVDLPHARIRGLAQPVFGIGLTRRGLLPDEPPDTPETTGRAPDDTEIVWLLLLPPGGVGLRPTAQVARACRDGEFRGALRDADGPDAVRTALARWETTNETSPSNWST